ncbi:hypothetical protein ACQJBY_002737 [Aegilops geniculata]
METSVIVVSVVVGLFGVGSAVLGFIAEGTKLEPNDISMSRTECVYPANPAFALGLVAALLLLVAQITVSAAGRCCGCCKPRGAAFSVSRRNIGVVFAVLSWVATVIAEIYFLQGAAWNAPVTREVNSGCYFVRDGVFRRAAILSIIATVLGIKSYFLLRAAAATAAAAAAAVPGYPGAVAGPSSAGEPKPDGIAMGHPAPMYGQAPYAHYPPPPNAQGYGQYPPPPNAQGYGQYPPPAQGYGHGHFQPAAPPQGQGYGQAV